MEKYESILKDSGLKITEIRLRMLKLLVSSGIALSHADICEQLGDGFDKVTIYRNLHTFVEKGVIHETPNDGRSSKFAFAGKDNEHTGAHAHFICEICGNTYCLGYKSKAGIMLPDDFKISNLSVVAEGVCSHCGKKREIGKEN